MTLPGAIRIVCDRHRKPHLITRFVWTTSPDEWVEFIPGTAEFRRDLDGMRQTDRPGAELFLVGDEPVNDGVAAGAAMSRTLHPNQCDRCGAGQPLTAGKMHEALSLVRAAGESSLTLKGLAMVTQRLSAGRPLPRNDNSVT